MTQSKYNCLFCGKEISYLRHSRERKFCCDSHRSMFWQKKRKHRCLLCEKPIDMRSKLCMKCARSQDNHPNWQGGITKDAHRIRCSIEYRLWREAVFARDNFICQKCSKRGGNLEAHHIKSFKNFPELRFAIDNGLTLCVLCHNQTKKKLR